MRKILLIALIFVGPSLVYAAEGKSEDECINIYNVAKNFMHLRQIGVPVVDQMKLIDDSKITKHTKEFMRIIVEKAYEKPKFSSEEYKAEATTEFANEWYIACRKVIREGEGE
ncbi:hypothetical protein E3H47_04835 [Acinetobacter radioresistens]|uniref:hypothetical protein n=1 Tax=Acinetobacter radioresistens TaxID=40216 RepID=UPI0010CCFB1E|nr:hypothetical protein [Acinetobacter radioresistens]MCM1934631.1 hypothetical protein [Acinetobacter radioresistens]MCM1952082.1 hypothetical protein [Acinetobacter radioresistens]QCS11882.1 hypothetical protein E3H47_04835 [Acinetobacter radioresistens]